MGGTCLSLSSRPLLVEIVDREFKCMCVCACVHLLSEITSFRTNHVRSNMNNMSVFPFFFLP